MKQTIFGIFLGLLLVLSVYVGVEMYEKYSFMNSDDFVKPTTNRIDIDGIKYYKSI